LELRLEVEPDFGPGNTHSLQALQLSWERWCDRRGSWAACCAQLHVCGETCCHWHWADVLSGKVVVLAALGLIICFLGFLCHRNPGFRSIVYSHYELHWYAFDYSHSRNRLFTCYLSAAHVGTTIGNMASTRRIAGQSFV